MNNCKHLQILVTNQNGTTTTHTFNQNDILINCIINSSHKFINSAGQLLDSSKLTNIKKHSSFEQTGTHIYIADEIPTCVGEQGTATMIAPYNCDIKVKDGDKCTNYYTTGNSDGNNYQCSGGGGSQCINPYLNGSCKHNPDCLKTFQCTIK